MLKIFFILCILFNYSATIEIGRYKGDTMLKRILKISVVAVMLLLAGCGGSNGNDGVNGVNGAEGLAGKDGKDGINGTNGVDANSSLISMLDEPRGSHCEYGGVKISTGMDSNHNAVLDPSEVEKTEYICSEIAKSFNGAVYVADKDIDGMNALYATTSDSSVKLAAPASSSQTIHNMVISPDKTKVFYITKTRRFPYTYELYVTDLLQRSIPMQIGKNIGHTITSVGKFGWLPDSSRIIYIVSISNGSRQDLYSVLRDGSGNMRLNPSMDGRSVLEFSVAPDSSKITYIADQDSDDVFEVYSVSPDGTHNTKISGPMTSGGHAYIYSMWWAPDSSKVVYLADEEQDDSFELFAVFPDGTGHVKLNKPLASSTADVSFESNPKWAPDSSRFAYVAQQDNAAKMELYTVKPDGSGNVKVSGNMVFGGNVVNAYGGWAPDSSRIIYRADQESDERVELYSASPLGGETPIKLNDTLVSNGDVNIFKWLPDGSRVIYRANEDNSSRSELYSVQSNGSDHLKLNSTLTGTQQVRNYILAPDSSKVAFFSDQGDTQGSYNIFTVSPTGTQMQQVSARTTSGSASSYGWLPDSSKIVYISDEGNSIGQNELYSVNADGSSRIKHSGSMIPQGNVSSFRY